MAAHGRTAHEILEHGGEEYGKVYFRHRRGGVRPGEGDRGGLPGAAAEGPGAEGGPPEVRPLPEPGPGHHEPLSARGGLRHRGRGGDRPGSGALRAVHRRGPDGGLLRHLRKGLLVRSQPGAGGGLPGGHGPGDPPHHRRDQGAHLPGGPPGGGGRGHHRDRRHGGGYRVPALPGGHPSGGGGGGAAERALSPRLPHRLHPRHRGAEEQAHPALGEGAAGPGHPTRRDPLPVRRPPPRRGAGQDRPVLQRAPGPGHLQRDRAHPV